MMKIFYILIVVVVCIELFSEKVVYLNKPDMWGVCVCRGVHYTYMHMQDPGGDRRKEDHRCG